MTKVDWAKVKSAAIKHCTNCKSNRCYTNPFSKCYECKKQHCFDCLNALQFNRKMSVNDELRDICDKCRDERGYFYYKLALAPTF